MKRQVTHKAEHSPAATVQLPDGQVFSDLFLSARDDGGGYGIQFNKGCFRYVAHVNVDQVPLYLALLRPLVIASGTAAWSWIQKSLDTSRPPFVDGSDEHSSRSVGVLLQAVEPTLASRKDSDHLLSEYPVTEVLCLQALRSELPPLDDGEVSPDPASETLLCAILLSSRLLYAAASFPTGGLDEEAEAIFLPNPTPATPHQADDLLPIKPSKEDSLNDLFNSVAERRRKARKKGGQGISLAASRSNSQTQMPGPKSETDGEEGILPSIYQDLPNVNILQGRHRRPDPQPATKPPTKPPSRPSSRTGTDRKRSSLAQVQTPDDSSFHSRNRQTISKTVMAGMRMYGLQQRKGADSQIDTALGDDEYKGVYHQTFKGAVFALRRGFETELLRPDAVREVVDRLLAVFCGEVG